MFDRSTYVAPPSTTINVKQQPNDAADAARLYGECVTKAEKAVAGATVEKLGARNDFTVVKVETMRNFATDQRHVRLLFKVNGEQYDLTCVDDSREIGRAAYRELAMKLVGEVMQKLMPDRLNP